MADTYCSSCFRTGEELDAALQKALLCEENAEKAGKAAEEAASAKECIVCMDVTSEVVPHDSAAPGVVKTVNEDGSVHLHFNVPEGPQGETGPVGPQGPAGAGDMVASVYDPQGKQTDVFAYVDNAVSGQINSHNTDGEAHVDIRAAMPTILLKNW